MNLQSLFPPPSIAAYVSSIFVLEDGRLHSGTGFPLYANGCPCICFQVSDEGILSIGDKKTGNFVLYGQTIKPVGLHTQGRLTLIAYFLYPHALKTLFGFDANELTDLGIDLQLLSPAREMNIKEQLLNAGSLDSRLQIMNRYVSGLSQAKGAIVNQAILFAAKTVRDSGGLVSLQELQKEVYISERNFRRLFEFHIGVSPKMFGRVCQFDAAFRQLNQNNFSRLSDIAFSNGYADQSHLIRSFREFTRYSPREYVKNTAEFQLLNP